MRLLLLVLVAVLLSAGTAHAGGWATVELDELPSGVVAGEPVDMQLLVKQHGRTPLDGLQPSVEISNDAGVVKTFPARPAGRTGWYEATVTYPSDGTWRTRLYDGFTDAIPHRLAPLEVAPAGGATTAAPIERRTDPAPDSARGGFPWPQAIAIAFFAVLWLAAWVVISGPPRRRRAPAAGRYLPAR